VQSIELFKPFFQFLLTFYQAFFQKSSFFSETGKAVLSSWAKIDTLYSSISQKYSSIAFFFSSDTNVGQSFIPSSKLPRNNFWNLTLLIIPYR